MDKRTRGDVIRFVQKPNQASCPVGREVVGVPRKHQTQITAEELKQQVEEIERELDVDRDYAIKLLELQQNERMLAELEDIEVHTQNIVRTGAKNRGVAS